MFFSCYRMYSVNIVSSQFTGKNATTPVGFTAVLTHDVTLGPHQTLEYDKVLTNIGEVFHNSHERQTRTIYEPDKELFLDF